MKVTRFLPIVTSIVVRQGGTQNRVQAVVLRRQATRMMSSKSSSDNNNNIKNVGLTTDDQTDAAKRRKQGEWVRGVSSARDWIEDSEDAKYPVEAGRYHLYLAYNCPWCHRVLLGRAIQGLEDAISVDVLFPNRSSDSEPLGPNLWKFEPDGQVGQNGKHVSFPSCTVDTGTGKNYKYVKEIYEASGITDQKSVPILYDKKTKTIVNNESAEILRMFGTVFQKLSKNRSVDLYPEKDRAAIDELNDWVYKDVANGAYKAGFSSSQETYENAYEGFFAALDKLDNIFASNKFLVGDSVTEADVRLFPPLFRFDPVYHNRFKLNKKFMWEYPHLWRWMGDMMRLPGMEHATSEEYLQHCKQGYFGRTGNGTVPKGPLGYPECYKSKHWTHQKMQ